MDTLKIRPSAIRRPQFRPQPRGNALWAVLLVLTTLAMVGGGVSFFILSNKAPEVVTESPENEERAARSDRMPKKPQERFRTEPQERSQTELQESDRTPARVQDDEATLSNSESERVLEFYMQRLEAAGTEPEGDLVNEVLSLGFAVVNEVQNIALDTIELPPGWDADYGDTLHEQMMEKWALARDSGGMRRVERIVRRLERFVPKGTPKFKVHLLQEADFNAFAVAGGHIYVTTGMLEFVKSDAELAAVLGHEMAHEFKGHCKRKMKILTLANAGLGDLGAMAANIGLFLSAPFGKSDELDADASGRAICIQAGFARSGMMQFLERMARAEPDQEDYLTKIMSTHPYTRERIQYLRQR